MCTIPLMDVKRPWSLSNGTTNAIRMYLRNMTVAYVNLTRQETLEEITKIIEDDPDSKWLAHNLLFLHLHIEEVTHIKSDLTYFSLINLDWEPIDPQLYIDLVFRCHLHEYFLLLITASRHLRFSRHFLSLVAERVLPGRSLPEPEPEAALERNQQQQQEVLTKEEWFLYLSILSWLHRASESHDEFYPHIHQKFLTHFLDLTEAQLSTISKIEILIQLSGLVCLKREDYRGNTEICDSLIELNFDPMIKLNETGAGDFFQEMFSKCNSKGSAGPAFETSSILDAPINLALVECMGNAVLGLKFEPESEICKILQGQQVRISRKMGKTLRYIGDYAYLTNLIIKKNILGQSPKGKSSHLHQSQSSNVASQIFLVANFLEKFKSKSRCEDYDFRTMKFDQFCTLVRSRSCAKYRHVQQSWHEKFLSFEEAFTTAEGYAVALECIAPNATLDIGVKMLKKILKMTASSPSAESVVEELKQIVLVLAFNPNIYCEFDQVVDLIFKPKTVHEKFSTMGFQGQLNELNLKLGAQGCLDLKSNTLSQSIADECRRLTLQNPLVAAQNILSRSLQLTKGGSLVLQSLRPFWALSVPPSNPSPIDESASCSASAAGVETKKANKNLFEHSLEQLILSVTDELTRNVQSKSQLKEFIPIFLNDGFITKEKFEEILLSTVLTLLETQSNDTIVAVLDVYQDLVGAVITQAKAGQGQTNPNIHDFLQLTYSNIAGLREGTYFSPAMDSNNFRDKTIEILSLLLNSSEALLLKPVEVTEENLKIVELPLTSLVLLYARAPAWRPVIQAYLKSSQDFFDTHNEGQEEDTFKIPLGMIEEIIRNSSPLEWNDVMDILYEMYHRGLDGDGGNVFEEWMEVMSKIPLLELLRKDETLSEFLEEEGGKKKRWATLEQQQMKSPPLVFQHFGLHLVQVLTGSGSGSGTGNKPSSSPYRTEISKYPAVQLELVKSFVATACHFPDEPQYFLAKQSALMSLLNLIRWIVSTHNPKDQEFLEECFTIVKALKKADHGKLTPICLSIIDVQPKGKKNKMASIISVDAGTEKESEVQVRLREMNEYAERMNLESPSQGNYCKMKILNPNSSDSR